MNTKIKEEIFESNQLMATSPDSRNRIWNFLISRLLHNPFQLGQNSAPHIDWYIFREVFIESISVFVFCCQRIKDAWSLISCTISTVELFGNTLN